jgi:hypothetical protein
VPAGAVEERERSTALEQQYRVHSAHGVLVVAQALDQLHRRDDSASRDLILVASYQVWWLLDDGSQGATTVASRDEAKELLDEKRLELRVLACPGACPADALDPHACSPGQVLCARDPATSPPTSNRGRPPPRG